MSCGDAVKPYLWEHGTNIHQIRLETQVDRGEADPARQGLRLSDVGVELMELPFIPPYLLTNETMILNISPSPQHSR